MTRVLSLMSLVVFVVAVVVGCPAGKPAGPEAPVALPEAPLPPDLPEAAVPPSGGLPTGLSGELVVAVPCGVAMAYKAARDVLLEANPDLRFTEHVKNVGPLVREILDGKVNMDVFVSLGEKELDRLVEAGMVEGELVPFIRHELHLAVQLGNPLDIRSLDDLARPEVETVAVPAPELSIGHYGQKALQSAGVWDELVAANRIVRPDQPLKAKQLLYDKKADAAFVYGACSEDSLREADPERSLQGKAEVAYVVPREVYGGMFGVAAVLRTARDPELARAFVEFLRSPAAYEALAEWGYGRPE